MELYRFDSSVHARIYEQRSPLFLARREMLSDNGIWTFAAYPTDFRDRDQEETVSM